MQEKKLRVTNADRSASMRTRLLDAARQLFVSEGFAATSTPAIVEAAGVTRGALYHHFKDKEAIFRAVVEAEAEAVSQAIDAADMSGVPPLDQLLAGASAYIEAMRKEGRVRLLLLEGPTVLGREVMREIEGRHGDANLRIGVDAALTEAKRSDLDVESLCSLLSAMFERAAMDIDGGRPTEPVLAVIEAVLRGALLTEHSAKRDPRRTGWRNARRRTDGR